MVLKDLEGLVMRARMTYVHKWASRDGLMESSKEVRAKASPRLLGRAWAALHIGPGQGHGMFRDLYLIIVYILIKMRWTI